jgi:type I restriction enzyme, S subunit
MRNRSSSLWRLARYENGFPFKPDDFGSTGLPVIRIRQLIDAGAESDLTERRSSSRYLLSDGDLIFSWSGSLAVRTWDRGPAWLNQHLFKVVPEPDVNQGWLRWVIEASIPEFEGMMHGSAMTHLTHDMLKQLRIDVPSVDEQRCIADFLDTETARIDRLFDLQSSVRAAVLSRAAANLDLRIDELAKIHGTLPFRRLILSAEQGTSPQCDNFPAAPDAWGVLKVSSVKNGLFLEQENKQLPGDVEPEHRYEIKHGDLLITRANTPRLVGAAAVADSPRKHLMLCDKIFRITTSPDLLKEFLVLVSLSTRIRAICAEISHGTSQSMANLKIEDIKSWPIPTAPVSVQRAIITQLSEARDHATKLTDSIDSQLALLAERRQALIIAAVMGQTNVITARGTVASGGAAR